ncbi:MAG: T9SS type A sorting domain-containing protein [Mucilaginibacter polytrichastri]|nr:T9SS type A sorting domain-containing protein [Mucilaginibacter polytrichastri]
MRGVFTKRTPAFHLFTTAAFFTLFFMAPASHAAIRNWIGNAASGDKSSWNLAANWLENAVPTAADDVYIGANFAYVTAPVIKSAPGTIKSLTFGPLAPFVKTLTVNGGLTLNVTGDILQQHSGISIQTSYQSTLQGDGTVNCANMRVGNDILSLNISIGYTNTTTFRSTINQLNVSGNVVVRSSDFGIVVLVISLVGSSNALFSLDGGTMAVGGQIITSNQVDGISILPLITVNATYRTNINSSNISTLKLLNPAPFVISNAGKGFIDLYNQEVAGATGRTVTQFAYSGAAQQTVFLTGVDTSPTMFQDIGFSDAGTKLINTPLTLNGNWISAGGKIDAVSSNPTVSFQGTDQTLTDNASDGGNGVAFKNVVFSGGGTKTMSAGRFSVISTGTLSINGASTLNANGNLTLKSDVSGSAQVPAIASGSSVIGTVNAERFLTGGYGRGYRLVSSPVHNASIGADNQYYTVGPLMNTSLFGLNATLITGPAGGGWDVSNLNNPSVWVYREADPFPGNSRIKDSDYKGLMSSSTPVPVGSGLLFFNRGNRQNASLKLYGSAFPSPENYAVTFSGTLNQGTIQARVINNDLNNFSEISTFNPQTKYYYNGSMAPAGTTLSYTPSWTGNSDRGTNGFNLLGNPYASTIDLDAVTFTGADANLYTFNPANKQFTWYQRGSSGNTTDGNGASRYLASGQGFFVKANTASASVTFTENSKAASQLLPATSPLLLMGAPVTAKKTPRLLLRLEKDSLNYDGIGIFFDERASYSTDTLDAPDMDGISPQVFLSSVSADERRMAINMLPALKKEQQVKLYVNTTTSGLFSLVKTALDDIPPVYDIWLLDRKMKDSLDLRSNSTYTFHVSREDSTSFGSTRFELVFRKKPLPPYALLNFTGENSSGKAVLRWNVRNEFSYYRFSLEKQGEKGFEPVAELDARGLGSYEWTDQHALVKDETYRLKQTDSEGESIYSEALTINAVQQIMTGENSIYPNPASDIIRLNIPGKEKAELRIMDTGGHILLRRAGVENGTAVDVRALKPGFYLADIRDPLTGKRTVLKWIKQ